MPGLIVLLEVEGEYVLPGQEPVEVEYEDSINGDAPNGPRVVYASIRSNVIWGSTMASLRL